MSEGIIIGSLVLIAMQTGLIVYMAHNREKAGDEAERYRSMAADLRDRVATRDDALAKSNASVVAGNDAVAKLELEAGRLKDVVKMVEGQRDEALDELRKHPGTPADLAAAMRDRLQALSQVSGDPPTAPAPRGDGH